MKKRIAFISEHASPLATLGGVDAGGQNVYVDKLTKQLLLAGYAVDIYTRWDDPRLPEVVDCQNGIRVIHVKAGPVKYVKKEEIFQYMDEFTQTMLNFMEHHDAHPLLIHANFWMSAYVAMNIKRLLGIPFIVTFHALGKVRRLHQGKADGFPDSRFAFEEQAIKEADHIIAECPQDKEDLIVHYRANQDKITIIPCGFDPNEFHPIDKRLARMTLGLDPDEKIILQLGRMVPRKGVDTVVQALSLLKNAHEKKIRLLIVGGESEEPDPTITPEVGRLQKMAQELGVEDLVTFVGRRNRDQLKYYYNAADVFISVPWYEPFGITPLEAMACGTPVIGSKVGGIKFSVEDDKTGYLIPPKNPEKLAEKITQLLNNPEREKVFRENAIKRVNTFFTWETVSQRVSALYSHILNESRSRTFTQEKQSQIIHNNFSSLIHALQLSEEQLEDRLIQAAKIMSDCLSTGGKILTCGNGGSATDSQHFAEELVGKYMVPDRPGLPVLSLTSDMSIITAVANDFSFETAFARQVEAYGQPGDILLGISTSGNSENIIEAFRTARENNMVTIGLLGKNGGKVKDLSDISLIVPSQKTGNIQEVHTHLIHTLCELIEKQLFSTQEEGKQEQHYKQVGVKFGKSSIQSKLLRVKGGKK